MGRSRRAGRAPGRARGKTADGVGSGATTAASARLGRGMRSWWRAAASTVAASRSIRRGTCRTAGERSLGWRATGRGSSRRRRRRGLPALGSVSTSSPGRASRPRSTRPRGERGRGATSREAASFGGRRSAGRSCARRPGSGSRRGAPMLGERRCRLLSACPCFSCATQAGSWPSDRATAAAVLPSASFSGPCAPEIASTTGSPAQRTPPGSSGFRSASTPEPERCGRRPRSVGPERERHRTGVEADSHPRNGPKAMAARAL